MTVDHLVIANHYRDSVSLMQIATGLRALDGIDDAAVVMMTPANLAMLDDVGLSIAGLQARPSDLLVVVVGSDEEVLAAALERATASIEADADGARPSGGEVPEEPSRSLVMAAERLEGLDLVIVSTPGEYAIQEAEKALRLGANVMLFSDGIDLDEERRLKLMADERGLIVMGPDCGTAIIGGIPLAFANEVRRGSIGIVGAAGTGIQAIACAIDNLGAGISHAIGIGGHDLSEHVGGISMRRGIAMLGVDPSTDVIVLVSKPPSARIASEVIEAARGTGKPVVVCFLGSDSAALPSDVHAAVTLGEAAAVAVRLAQGADVVRDDAPAPTVTVPRVSLAPGQRYVRGLYSGGTLCFEATMLLGRVLPNLSSNTPLPPATAPDDPWRARGHTLVDLGDDVFTRGRPHPMIDHTLRNDRLVSEAGDPEVAVVLLDVVLGHGSHPDPASAMAPAIEEAGRVAASAGRTLPLVATVIGTDRDPQRPDVQVAALRELGVHVEHDHARAVEVVARILTLQDVPIS